MNAKFPVIFAMLICFLPPELLPQTNLRAWFADGQTWLVWEDGPDYPETYLIYQSDAPISGAGQARQIGRIFLEDAQGIRLKRLSDALHWTIPDGTGGTYTLAENEGLFVYTPHVPGDEYFAVLRDDQSLIGAGNRAGPVTQSIDPIQCHLQVEGLDQDCPYRVMAHWIDGSSAHDSGRVDYPVMGNAHFNGMGRLFRIWDYPEGERPEKIPLCVGLHGGGGWYGAFAPWKDAAYKTYRVNAMVFCPDDGVMVRFNEKRKSLKTYWIGYRSDYNPFYEPEDQPVPDDALVVNYTMRRILWEIDWLIAHEAVDPTRVSLMGGSMGARGANYLARAYPDRFAAYIALCPGIVPQPGDPLLGSAEQNLQTNLPGNPGVLEVMDLHTNTSGTEIDVPFGKIVGGKNDGTLAALTTEMVRAYQNVNNAALGTHIYWDDRGHVFTAGSYWSDSYRLMAEALNAYRSNQSFPGFFNDDRDPYTQGRQPELLGGGPGEGDPWGTWGGYYWWDPASIVDSASYWKVELGLMTESEYPNDVPDFETSTTDMVLRKPQRFSIANGQGYHWQLRRYRDDQLLREGFELADQEGRVIIRNLILTRDWCVLSIQLMPVSERVEWKSGQTKYDRFGFQVYPNPVLDAARIRFRLAFSGWVRVTLHDVTGRLAKTLVHQAKAAGVHEHRVNAGELPPGLYCCRLTTRYGTAGKMIVLGR